MHARVRTVAVAAALAAGLTLGTHAQTPATRTLELSFPEPGLVTLAATNVTVREILADWTRQTGAVFTNADRLAGGPVTVQYERQPEEAVVRSLLRAAAGLMIVPRDPGPVARSRVAAVYIVPASRGTTGTSYVPSAPSPMAADLVTPGSPDLEIPPAMPNPENRPAQTPPAVGRPTTPGVIVPIVPIIGTGSGRGGAGGGGRGTPPPPPTGTGSGS